MASAQRMDTSKSRQPKSARQNEARVMYSISGFPFLRYGNHNVLWDWLQTVSCGGNYRKMIVQRRRRRGRIIFYLYRIIFYLYQRLENRFFCAIIPIEKAPNGNGWPPQQFNRKNRQTCLGSAVFLLIQMIGLDLFAYGYDAEGQTNHNCQKIVCSHWHPPPCLLNAGAENIPLPCLLLGTLL